MKWHKYPDEKPKPGRRYIVYGYNRYHRHNTFGISKYYDTRFFPYESVDIPTLRWSPGITVRPAKVYYWAELPDAPDGSEEK